MDRSGRIKMVGTAAKQTTVFLVIVSVAVVAVIGVIAAFAYGIAMLGDVHWGFKAALVAAFVWGIVFVVVLAAQEP